MDKKLGQFLLDMEVMHFGKLGTANKNDSRSVIFDPRNLLSSPEVLRYIGKKMARLIRRQCTGNVIVGLTTAGIGFGAVASLYADLPFLYLRDKPKLHLTMKWLEGRIPKKPTPKMIVVDELLFNADTKKRAVAKLKELGYAVTDVVVVIDRQLQKKADGPSLEKLHGVRLHSLITMDEIVKFLLIEKKLSQQRLQDLITDYREYERWHLPVFAQKHNEKG